MNKVKRVFTRMSPLLRLVTAVWLIGIALMLISSTEMLDSLFTLGVVLVSFVVIVSLYKAHSAAAEIRLLRQDISSIERKRHRDSKRYSTVNELATRHRVPPLFSDSESDVRKPRVAIIGTPSLLHRFDDALDILPLYPGIAEALFEVERPTALIIEEDALHTGSWNTSLSISGAWLFNELLTMRDKAVAADLEVYVVPSNRIDYSTHALRHKATVVLDEAFIYAYEHSVVGFGMNRESLVLSKLLSDYVKG